MSENNNNLQQTDNTLPLRSAEDVDLATFNKLRSPDDKQGKPVKDMRRLFHKQVIIDNETTLDVETIKVPGFIGIADEQKIKDSNGNTVSGHEDIVQFLDRYGLLICTYQYNKDRYGQAIDLRNPPKDYELSDLVEIFIKNEGHHSGAIVPALWNGGVKAFGSLNEPDAYHDGLYGHNGFIAVAQRLVFPPVVTPQQARGYTDSMICWMALMNPFVEFSQNDFNGNDPTRVCDRPSLKEFLQNCALASLGSQKAINFLKNLENRAYCAEFIYICLNTPIYPFNKQGLTLLLDGDKAKATEILKIRDAQNSRKKNILSNTSQNPQFKNFNIQMPVVPEDLLPLDVLMARNGQPPEPKSIPFPPFTLSQVLRRAFRTLLKRQEDVTNTKIAKAQAQMFEYLEPLILRQLGLIKPPSAAEPLHEEDLISRIPKEFFSLSPAPNDPKVKAVREFIAFVQKQLQRKFDSYEEFDLTVDQMMAKADELGGTDGVTYFVPPRIYVDFGQNDGDNNLPKGWGFGLKTVGALISRGIIKGSGSSSLPSDGGPDPVINQPSNQGNDQRSSKQP
ncbi:MAG: hypothetical protein HC862_11965 [Scytonema sp. RU_4_4]|nr:hypothetical protein [Scytonema sp. RU_4_4]NJR73725.1 hypothetical protein [Scytonema sp. CRU_2_7]